MCLWAIYLFPRSICLFCCRKICGPILGIYKLLTYTWIWKLGLRPRNSQKRDFFCSARYYYFPTVHEHTFIDDITIFLLHGYFIHGGQKWRERDGGTEGEGEEQGYDRWETALQKSTLENWHGSTEAYSNMGCDGVTECKCFIQKAGVDSSSQLSSSCEFSRND
jgi:hypothetical protein